MRKRVSPLTLSVTVEQANAPRPQPPDNVSPQAWQHYWSDLACWKAMKADQMMHGIDARRKS